ncbi:MFS general substrate transporter [Xylariomycetidae sp. FL2044]|nr:MFS general substrate transporter [Xylariomycetidae sp. FL2044]
MEEDLQTRPRNEALYGWALTAFYLAYIAFEWMSLLWRLVPAHVYVSLVVLSWGLAASLQAVATSYPILIGLRALLGVGEAAFTGVPFYLSFFFRRRELAFRTAMFISAAPLATSFASTLAWLILKLGQNGPIAPWRLLFLLEGFPSVIIATVAWNVIPDSPGTAYYLSAREKKVARLRLRHENPSHSSSSESQRQQRHQRRGSASPSRLGARAVLSALVDAKAWITSLIFFLTNMAYSSLPVFLPQILTEMGHSPLESQALTAPPYLVSFLAVLLTAHLSDRLGSRSPFVVLHALASAAGYAVLAAGRAPMLRYAAVYPAAVGFFNVVVLVVSWSVNNQPDEGRRGGGFALLQVVGQCGPLLGTRLYPDSDKPFYERGMWVCAGAMLGVAVLAVALRAYLGWLNRRLGWKGEDKGLREGEDEDGNVDMDVEEAIGLVGNAAGDRDEGRDGERRVPAFRYML